MIIGKLTVTCLKLDVVRNQSWDESTIVVTGTDTRGTAVTLYLPASLAKHLRIGDCVPYTIGGEHHA